MGEELVDRSGVRGKSKWVTSGWQPFTEGASQGSVLGQFFHAVINGLDAVLECILSKFA